MGRGRGRGGRGGARRPDVPIAVVRGRDFYDGPMDSLTVILRTVGCYRAREGRACTMCGYIRDCATTPPTSSELVRQMERALSKAPSGAFVLKLYTSGSFFDPTEVPEEARRTILRMCAHERVERLVVETRCELATKNVLEEAASIMPRLEIAIGLESASDAVRGECIGKGTTFSDYEAAVMRASALGIPTKTYLLLKPPFLSEGEAMQDVLSSIEKVAPLSRRISVNLCNVQRGTLVERLWRRGEYRPPWLASAVEILLEAKRAHGNHVIMCDPVGAGSARGPHNCGRCDRAVANAIRSFSETQDVSYLEEVREECECYGIWRRVLALDHRGYGTPAFL
ncbi:MAG TPA: archaeosine biosynthesis radical SAM protein RaSEA [Methermicoccus shengliensis]|uniref:Archaeosine biosynthesis radical SAM protein RaSEA n=2 Tax=Methermicoccus shengliensis TaxID=660064 RepID=A0A832RTP8_9EURY|nr:archaeosine biosynthesis radical SAM protein RaSEA [Methermicoccus shengliensis]